MSHQIQSFMDFDANIMQAIPKYVERYGVRHSRQPEMVGLSDLLLAWEAIGRLAQQYPIDHGHRPTYVFHLFCAIKFI